MSDREPLIVCSGVSKSYRKGDTLITPLEGLDLEVRAGEFVALMGPSGSGKTTLLNLLSGIDRPTAGTLRIGGVNVGALSRSALADWRSTHVGYVFQLYNLVPVLTAYENVELPLLLHKQSARERHEKVRTALELVGIADRHDHYPRQLSGGQEQRVAIARAIMDLLCRLCGELGKTLIMVTHDSKAAAYAGRRLRLEKGRLLDDQRGPMGGAGVGGVGGVVGVRP